MADGDAIGSAPSHGSGHGDAQTIVVNDSALLFSGDYKRSGVDLVLSKDGHEHVVSDYFKGSVRATLSSADGATLSGDLVTALVGEVQVAQAGGAANSAAQVIGSVTKLTGSATAIRNGVSVMLNVGDNVQKGDVVQAGPDSSLGLTFIDGTVFGLSSNARMVLNEMIYDPNGSANSSLLSLVQGTITFVAGETAKHGDMRVDTPVATMGIRGTAVLVEIDFVVPGTTGPGGTSVKFQVLVEPGGKVGSYVLYSKSDPSVVIGTVDQAGQQAIVTPLNVTFGQAPPLSPEVIAILTPVFQQFYGTYNPNPRSTTPGGSAPSDPVPGSSNPEPLKFNPFLELSPGGVKTLPIDLKDQPPNTPPVQVVITAINTAPSIASAKIGVSEGGTAILSTANFNVTDADSSSFTFTVSNVSHGVFQTSTDGISWTNATTFTTADLVAGHVRFVHDGGEAPPTFSVQANDGAASNNLSGVVAGTITFENVNDAPVITSAALTVAKGGTVIVHLSDIGITDPDSDSSIFTFRATSTHGTFEKLVAGEWVTISSEDTVTSADITAGHVRFHHDGSTDAPVITVTVSDGIDSSAPHPVTVTFSSADTIYHLTSTAGTSIDISGYGATSGFVLPGGGNVTTPGTPEDRIVLGYKIDGATSVLNAAPMVGARDFTLMSHTQTHNQDGSNSVTTVLGANHGVTLTQTITLGADANFFTTTIDVLNNGNSALNDVRFMRNFDPDQDVQSAGDYSTKNDVVHTPTSLEPFAIVTATGIETGTVVALIGLSGNWRGSSYGFTNTDPYAPEAYASPVDPNGASSDSAIALTYDFGTIGVGQHVTVTYITTNNVATSGSNALYGTVNADIINGLGGDDLLIGLGGADTFVFSTGSGHDTILDFQTGTDKIDASAYTALPTDFSTWKTAGVLEAMGSDTLVHLSATDTILLKNVGINDLTAGDFGMSASANHAPVFNTSSLGVIEDGEVGTIRLTGLSVSDPDSASQMFTLSGTTEHGDVSNPEPFNNLSDLNDSLSFSGVVYQVGEQSPPYIEKVTVSVTDASQNSDTLNFIFSVGATGPTVFTGDTGKDLLVGTYYDDTMTGGEGADQFIFGARTGHDTIMDFKPSTDKIDLHFSVPFTQGNESAFDIWLATHTSPSGTGDTLIRLDPTDTSDQNTILLKNVTADQLHVGDFIVHSYAM